MLLSSVLGSATPEKPSPSCLNDGEGVAFRSVHSVRLLNWDFGAILHVAMKAASSFLDSGPLSCCLRLSPPVTQRPPRLAFKATG